MNTEYHYLVMSQTDLLENEVVEELVRERADSYFLSKKNHDFWIIISPKFLDNFEIKNRLHNSNFYFQKQNQILSNSKKLEFYACIISTNKEFITWLKLRLGYFENIDDLDQKNLNKFISNGIYGKLTLSNFKENESPLSSNNKKLIPSILLNKYSKLLNIYL